MSKVIKIKQISGVALIVYGVYFDFLLSRNYSRANMFHYNVMVYGYLVILVVSVLGLYRMIDEISYHIARSKSHPK